MTCSVTDASHKSVDCPHIFTDNVFTPTAVTEHWRYEPTIRDTSLRQRIERLLLLQLQGQDTQHELDSYLHIANMPWCSIDHAQARRTVAWGCEVNLPPSQKSQASLLLWSLYFPATHCTHTPPGHELYRGRWSPPKKKEGWRRSVLATASGAQEGLESR